MNTGGQSSQILSNDLPSTSTTDPKQTQRLTTHHSNGSLTSSSNANGHESNSANGHDRFVSSSTQTILTNSSNPSHNNNTNSSRIYTNSQKEVLRLIGQHLQSVGLNKTVDILIHESGCVLEHEQASNFRELIMSGKWSDALVALEKLKQYIEERDGIQQMKYLILEQKYFELIEDNRPMDALQCLRNEIQGLKIRIERTHELTTFLMFNSIKDMYKAANWSGKGFASRQNLMEKLQKFLPPDIMLPPKRLESLLSQAVELQQERCTYHVKPGQLTLDDVSLLKDHLCTKQTFPCVTIQTLTEHSDEVWFCKFSPDGTKLATGDRKSVV